MDIFNSVIFILIGVYFMAGSAVMIVLGAKALKNHEIDVSLSRLLFRFFSDGNPELVNRFLYPKKIADEKTDEFYSSYSEMKKGRVTFLGVVMLVAGVVIFFSSLALFSSIILTHLP